MVASLESTQDSRDSEDTVSESIRESDGAVLSARRNQTLQVAQFLGMLGRPELAPGPRFVTVGTRCPQMIHIYGYRDTYDGSAVADSEGGV